MRKAEWKESYSALRAILSKIQDQDLNMHRAYRAQKFIAFYLPDRGVWCIWNRGIGNAIATVKKTSDYEAVVRYRESSFYSDILSLYQMGDRKMIRVPSTNLGRLRARASNILERVSISEVISRRDNVRLPDNADLFNQMYESVISNSTRSFHELSFRPTERWGLSRSDTEEVLDD